MHNAEKTIVIKPVPSRPFSSYRSFSDLVDGTINRSLTADDKIPAIKPKTVRFRPSSSNSLPSRPDVSEAASRFTSDKASATTSEAVNEAPSIYKPMAESVSKNYDSLMENYMVNDVGHQKTSVDDELQLQDINPENYLVQNQITSSFQHNSPSLVATREQDRQSCDGYNWRKYGQKQVKGSEYPRSYYKCTHPSCPMKKKVERSFDGNIAEIVYKGEHNHPKPQPAKRLAAVSEEQSFVNNNNNNIGNNLLGSSHDSFIGTTLSHYDGTPDLSGVCSGIENDNERHKSKKRKHKKRVNVEEAASQFVGDPEPLMQASTESTITGDGFRWRKYGQKIVKGNPYPRSYYRCSNLKCNVRKHIERVLDEPTSFIITYEGEHNHEMPDRTTNSAAQINILSAE
ncbi:uncharacterized protein A4U43_C02F2200 [Asparagus officinalis]|uniref:WRKY domain-containing protein n=1 Tax=Asparagus officinalis TaxID=4686 RepID=A0A5P1FFX6_ASPOF|nr:WRKY transcription factor 44-like isoform X1 [Asparagus officinalis]ONK77012.1 uncharacterized protein A4U43_C02F2200 [Asparagus officinalis]